MLTKKIVILLTSSLYGIDSKYFEVAETLLVSVIKPCDKLKKTGHGVIAWKKNQYKNKDWRIASYCPPCGRYNPMILSCTFNKPVYTEKFAATPIK